MSIPELRWYYFGVESFLAPSDYIRVRIVSKFLHYAFYPGPCFIDRLTRVPVFSKLARLHIPQLQDLSCSALESQFSLLAIITPTMLATVIIAIVYASSER